jgi:hypothetical protein
MRTLEHREVLSFLRGVLHALHVVQQRGGWIADCPAARRCHGGSESCGAQAQASADFAGR